MTYDEAQTLAEGAVARLVTATWRRAAEDEATQLKRDHECAMTWLTYLASNIPEAATYLATGTAFIEPTNSPE